MTRATITVTLTPDAQRAALLAGQPAAKTQTYDVPADLIPRLLGLPWTMVDDGGSASCVVPPRVGYDGSVTQPDGTPPKPDWTGCFWYGTAAEGAASIRPCDAYEAILHAEDLASAAWETVLAVRAKAVEDRDLQEAESRREAAEWAALPLVHRARPSGVGFCVPTDAGTGYAGPLSTTGRSVYDVKALQRLVPEAYAEAEAEVERLRAEVKEARQAAEAARLARLRSLAIKHGSQNARGRVGAAPTLLGLLPEAEAREIAREGLLPRETGDLRELELLTDDDVHEHCAPDCLGAVMFRAEPAEAVGLTAAEFDRLAHMREVLAERGLPPGVALVHRGQCDSRRCPDWPARKLGVVVTVDAGFGLAFDREYE